MDIFLGQVILILHLSIRTAVIKDDFIHVQAGAGIVYDSVPETEWEETMNKAMALLKASEEVTI